MNHIESARGNAYMISETHRIKIAFFDIDGTLVPFGESDMRDCVRLALKQLQRKGIKVFIATGRAPYFLPKFKDFTFDGALCFNGGYCYAGDEIIYKNPLLTSDIIQVVENAKGIGLPVALASATRFGSNFSEKNLEAYMEISHNTCNVIDDYDRLAQDEIFQMMVGTTPEQDAALIAGTRAVKVARWWNMAADVIPSNSGKAIAMEKVLLHYGYSVKECIAFGDGGNDIDMIEYAGIGVAMGNAVEAVKRAADIVADSCENDGVYQTLLEERLI